MRHAEWIETSVEDHPFEFQAYYRVRPPARQSVRGIDNVLSLICQQFITARLHAERTAREELDVRAYTERVLSYALQVKD